jgi:DNA-binding GntR family transcriptional regulator
MQYTVSHFENASMSHIPRLDIRKREDLRDQTYYQLRKAILFGPIPPGTVLVQEQLAEQMGISRTPVRDALDRLASEGLVVRSPGGRIHVAPFSLDELQEKYAVRKALEGLALRLAAPNLTGQAMQRLRALTEEMRQAIVDDHTQRVIQAGADFHEAIYIASGNAYLRQLLTALNDSIRRYRHVAIDMPGRAPETLREHELIVAHLEAGEVTLAESALAEHIARSQWRLEQGFQPGLQAGGDGKPA